MNTLMAIPGKNWKAPEIYDPVRHIFAALTERAVRDAFAPTRDLSQKEYEEAIAFLFDRSIERLVSDAGVHIPWRAIRRMWETKRAEQGEVQLSSLDHKDEVTIC